MRTTYSGGAVVVGDKGHVLVVNQNGNSWSLPKGHIESGEDEKAAAIRETEEESGITGIKFVKKLGSYQRFQIGLDGNENKDELKHITMFLCRAHETEPKPQDPQNPEARWAEKDEVMQLLTHPKDKTFFKRVLSDVEALMAES